MKIICSYILGTLMIFSFSNCANGQKLRENAPADFQQAYYTTWVGGVKGAGSGLNLFVPVITVEDMEVELDSVYFRGKKAQLVTKPQNPDLYIAYFKTSGNSKKAPDLIMSSDPKEEYGNQPPEIIRDFPFELKEDEAVLSFTKNGKKGYYKITGIQKKENDIKIKRPENIQH